MEFVMYVVFPVVSMGCVYVYVGFELLCFRYMESYLLR